MVFLMAFEILYACVAVFETKMAIGVVAPTAAGWFLFKRAQADKMRRDHDDPPW